VILIIGAFFMTQAPYPLLFEPSLHVKVWGGRWFESRLGKELPPGQPVGESWEIYWKNRVANGPWQGKRLGELIVDRPLLVAGDKEATEEFPLLIKFLDAQDWLSVQVHPDDAKAAELEGEPRGKTECWYIIEAEPGAQIAYGLSEQLDPASLREAINTGRARDVMQYVTVQAGDFIYVPAGTMHAIGPGILLYELQQTSDTTYRVYDWDRMGLDGNPRELHLDKALACSTFDVNPSAKIHYEAQTISDGVYSASLIRSPYFALDKLILEDRCSLDTGGYVPHALTAISGHIEVRCQGQPLVIVPQGTSAFIPAGVGSYQLIPDGDAEVLVAWPTVQ
jgi:mannose-6-phosphate isomerase